MNIVLIETSGNQHYIFATNKLRENVGASELTYQIGTKYVLKAVEAITGKQIWVNDDKDGSKLRANLLNAVLNPRIDDSDTKIEVVVATSGKAILLVKEQMVNGKSLAETIVSEVTKQALIEMPGLTVHGAIETVSNHLSDIHEAVGRVHRRLENLRYVIPSNQQRFLRLPHVEPCATSGLPASEIVSFKAVQGTQTFAFSKATISKRQALAKDKRKYANSDGFEKGRIIDLLQTKFNVILPENLEKLEDAFPNLKWTAIIHADGNGLGQIFLDFNQYAGFDGNGNWSPRKYLNDYRAFSSALDDCTINAAGYALQNLQREIVKLSSTGASSREVPAVPLILGGDDLTVICDGRYALKFTHDFLSEFETQTSQTDIIKQIAQKAFGVDRLGMCAGIAIIKPHYPFHQAYELAEQLLKSAKQVKTKITHMHNGKEVSLPCAALDFHILYDSSGTELNEIRHKLTVDEGKTHLFAKPYIVTTDLAPATNKDWYEPRLWNELDKRVCAMSAEDEDNKRQLPNSQLHVIRQSLHRGKTETDSEVSLFQHRYSDKGFDELLCEGDSLFFKETRNGVDSHTTHFMDALDAVEFWKGFDCSSNATKQETPAEEDAAKGDSQ